VRFIRTLRVRIAVAAGAAILAAVIVFAVVTVLVVDHELNASLNSALRQRAQEVAQLAVSAPGVLEDPGALEGPAAGRQLAVEVLDRRNRLVARSQALGAELLPLDGLEQAALRHARSGTEDIDLGGRPLRVLAAPIAEAGTPASGGVVLVAADTSDIAHTTHRLGVAVALCGAAVVLVAVLAAAALIRRGLRPLRELAAAAGEIERTADPSRRLPDTAPADELGELTGVLNRMLSALERARAGERRFLADASHELRTPVTALLGNAEYLARHGADAEVVADVRADAVRLARLVDSLLALERAGGAGRGSERVALDELARTVAAERDENGRVALGSLDAVSVAGDGASLGRAVANLVENGLVHGPVGGTVTVAVADGAGVARVSVTDEGPGPDPAARDHLFDRFWRGEEAGERPGSGLGLAIVAAIAAQHGGRVAVNGSTFTLELPAADAQVSGSGPGAGR
jgi:signal transduction histidine kinase